MTVATHVFNALLLSSRPAPTWSYLCRNKPCAVIVLLFQELTPPDVLPAGCLAAAARQDGVPQQHQGQQLACCFYPVGPDTARYPDRPQAVGVALRAGPFCDILFSRFAQRRCISQTSSKQWAFSPNMDVIAKQQWHCPPGSSQVNHIRWNPPQWFAPPQGLWCSSRDAAC
jgi:hypothetical protein